MVQPWPECREACQQRLQLLHGVDSSAAVGPQADIIEDGQLRKDLTPFWHQAEPCAGDAMGRRGCQILAVELHNARHGPM